jgi:hypothetical protein
MVEGEPMSLIAGMIYDMEIRRLLEVELQDELMVFTGLSFTEVNEDVIKNDIKCTIYRVFDKYGLVRAIEDKYIENLCKVLTITVDV